LLIDVELFGWSLQYVRMDTNAEISGGRAAESGLGASSGTGGGDGRVNRSAVCGIGTRRDTLIGKRDALDQLQIRRVKTDASD
jgi:hypothetical protein